MGLVERDRRGRLSDRVPSVQARIPGLLPIYGSNLPSYSISRAEMGLGLQIPCKEANYLSWNCMHSFGRPMARGNVMTGAQPIWNLHCGKLYVTVRDEPSKVVQ